MHFSKWLIWDEVTNSSEFRNWFANSVVVDDQGNPLVVYKGMYPYNWIDHPTDRRHPGYEGSPIRSINRPSEFPSFHNDEPGVKIAGFFGDRATANKFANVGFQSAIYPVYLSIQHPYVIDGDGKMAGTLQFGASGKPFRDAIRSGKYDGVIIKNTEDEGTIYIALNPRQIKSALGNRTFDPNSSNIDD